jgi:biopolymer transport protein ExbB
LNTLGQVYHGGAVVPVLLGMLLMVLVFSIERFCNLAAENNLDAFMTKIQASIKQGEIDEALQQQVTNAIKSALISSS